MAGESRDYDFGVKKGKGEKENQDISFLFAFLKAGGLMINCLQTYLYIALVLFAIGLYGVLARRNLIAVLISVELMLNAAMINFMAFNRFLAPHPAVGQIFTLFIMAVAAAEAAIALSIIIAVYRKLKSVNVEHATELRG